MSELTKAAMTALSSRRCAHIVVHARARRSFVATFCVRWGPGIKDHAQHFDRAGGA